MGFNIRAALISSGQARMGYWPSFEQRMPSVYPNAISNGNNVDWSPNFFQHSRLLYEGKCELLYVWEGATTSKYPENDIFSQVGGEFTPLLDKNLNIIRKLAKILALLLEPLSGPADLTQSKQFATGTSGIQAWEYLRSLVSLIYPLSHPSNTGKWSLSVGHFVNAFIQAYTRRMARERMSSLVVDDRTGRICDNAGVAMKSNRLGRAEDEEIVALFMPLLLQGIYSKNQTAGSAYESCIKRLCYLLPELTLEPVLEKVIAALEAVTESHQLQAALRLLAQLTPLIIQRTPGIIPQILNMTLPAIDGAEPFKTVQALTFYAVLFSHIGCRDLTDIEIEELPVDDVAEVCTCLRANTFENTIIINTLFEGALLFRRYENYSFPREASHPHSSHSKIIPKKRYSRSLTNPNFLKMRLPCRGNSGQRQV